MTVSHACNWDISINCRYEGKESPKKVEKAINTMATINTRRIGKSFLTQQKWKQLAGEILKLS